MTPVGLETLVGTSIILMRIRAIDEAERRKELELSGSSNRLCVGTVQADLSSSASPPVFKAA